MASLLHIKNILFRTQDSSYNIAGVPKTWSPRTFDKNWKCRGTVNSLSLILQLQEGWQWSEKSSFSFTAFSWHLSLQKEKISGDFILCLRFFSLDPFTDGRLGNGAPAVLLVGLDCRHGMSSVLICYQEKLMRPSFWQMNCATNLSHPLCKPVIALTAHHPGILQNGKR